MDWLDKRYCDGETFVRERCDPNVALVIVKGLEVMKHFKRCLDTSETKGHMAN